MASVSPDLSNSSKIRQESRMASAFQIAGPLIWLTRLLCRIQKECFFSRTQRREHKGLFLQQPILPKK